MPTIMLALDSGLQPTDSQWLYLGPSHSGPASACPQDLPTPLVHWPMSTEQPSKKPGHSFLVHFAVLQSHSHCCSMWTLGFLLHFLVIQPVVQVDSKGEHRGFACVVLELPLTHWWWGKFGRIYKNKGAVSPG